MKENREVISELRKTKGKTEELMKTTTNYDFEWPLRATSQITDYGYYGVSVFVDHDPAFPDSLLDYYGGERTYDRENGYNHQGTDIFPWPFGWLAMDSNLVEIISMVSLAAMFTQYSPTSSLDGVPNNLPETRSKLNQFAFEENSQLHI